MLEVRRIKRHHMNVLQQIYTEAYAGMREYAYTGRRRVISYLRWLFRRDPEGGYLALRDAEPAGFIFCDAMWVSGWSGEQAGAIHELAVLPEHRRRGIGRKLVLTGISYLRSRGCRLAELWVGEKNHPAINLYRTLGFTEAGRADRWIRMVKKL